MAGYTLAVLGGSGGPGVVTGEQLAGEVAARVAFLLRPEAACINDPVIGVDGGYSA